MAKALTFDQDDLPALDELFRRLTAKPGRLERMSKAQRWLSAKPAAGEPEVSVDLNVGEQVLNLVVTMSAGSGFEPGRELMPQLQRNGVTTPPGWQLMADVGWVLGWRAPKRLAPEQVMRFGFKVVKALGLEPADRRWKARIEGRPPRPGWAES